MRNVMLLMLTRFRGLSSRRRTMLGLLALFLGALLVSWIAGPTGRQGVKPLTTGMSAMRSPDDARIDAQLKGQWQRMKELPKAVPFDASPSARANMEAIGGSPEYGSPAIVHAAELAVATKEFARSRNTLEDILERHHGYAARLRMVGQPSGGLLTASLRVPATEFNGTVTDLKSLGNVEREEQSADEITQQRADLEARLVNAQSTLARLQGVLAKNSEVKDSAEVQRQLAAVNAEIARLEAERVAAEHRVIFANVLFSLREEIPPPVESFGAQFRSAGATGLMDALNIVSAILMFAISRGPVILVWVLLVFFPARWIWRKRQMLVWGREQEATKV
jgi:hypothetical protein